MNKQSPQHKKPTSDRGPHKGSSKLKHGSLFTGVGGLDLGFEAAGITTAWQCELDKQARSVIAKHWPNATRYVDVCEMNGATVEPVDVISFGSPCQDLSVAGKRAGFKDGTRSNLYFEAIRTIKEMRDETAGAFPRFAVWENVRGALSNRGGADFASALEALANIGAVDISWRVVNTCHFGPPQRRVRVFVVADFGGECAGEILAQPTRVLWHPPSSRTSRSKVAGEVEESAKGGGCETVRHTASTLQTECRETSTPPTTNCGNTQDATQTSQLTVYSYDGYNQKLAQDGTYRTLRTNNDSGDFVATQVDREYRVRRLTPRECERLQGWPDDHTRWADDGKELSNTTRYKMCGNGISAPVAQWLGENLIAAK